MNALTERLESAAETCTSTGIANLLRTAASLIRVQTNKLRVQRERIADLEAEIERLVREQSQWDEEIERLQNLLDHDLPGGDA